MGRECFTNGKLSSERRAEKSGEVEEVRDERELRGMYIPPIPAFDPASNTSHLPAANPTHEEDELISDSVSSTDGRDPDEAIDVDASGASSELPATTGKRIKREAEEDDPQSQLERAAEGGRPSAAKRRRVDGAPHPPLASRSLHAS